MYTENTFGVGTIKCINMFLKDVKRRHPIKMFDKYIPRGNCIRKKLCMYLFDLHNISQKVLRMFPLNKVSCHEGKKESCYLRSYESVKYACPYDDQIRFPILILRSVLHDLNHAKHQKWQELLSVEFFRPFPLKNLMSHLGVLDLDGMGCDK